VWLLWRPVIKYCKMTKYFEIDWTFLGPPHCEHVTRDTSLVWRSWIVTKGALTSSNGKKSNDYNLGFCLRWQLALSPSPRPCRASPLQSAALHITLYGHKTSRNDVSTYECSGTTGPLDESSRIHNVPALIHPWHFVPTKKVLYNA